MVRKEGRAAEELASVVDVMFMKKLREHGLKKVRKKLKANNL